MKKLLLAIMLLMVFSIHAYGADTEVQDLTDITAPAVGDDMYIVDNPDGTPASKKINIGNLLGVSPALDADGTITDDYIDSDDYAAGSVDAEHLAADVIDETKIADNGIDSEHYNDGSIDLVHIAAAAYAIDIVTTAPITGATDNVLVGADADVTLALDFTGAWNFGGASDFEIYNDAAPTTNVTGEIGLDTTIADHQPLLQYYDGGENMTVIAIDTAELPALDNEIVKYDAGTDKFVLEADGGAGGGATELWLYPSGAVMDDSSPPAITVWESSGADTSRRHVADFDPDTDEIIYWSLTWQGYSSADVYWCANDVGPNEDAIWALSISATTAADADAMSEDAADAANTESEDANETEAYRLMKTTIALSNTDGAATDDYVTIAFWRDADDSEGDADADALTSDARLLGVYLY